MRVPRRRRAGERLVAVMLRVTSSQGKRVRSVVTRALQCEAGASAAQAVHAFGSVARTPTLLDQLLPAYHFRERHSLAVDAPPDRAFAAIHEVTLREVPVFRLLFQLRALPARFRGRRLEGFNLGEPLVAWARRSGFLSLGQRPPEELAFGVIGQPWRLSGGRSAAVIGAEQFVAFATPGYVKVATTFRVEAGEAESCTRLSTETRVWATDEATRVRFALYWLVIRVGSGMIRQEWLRAVKRRAEGHRGWGRPRSQAAA